MFWPTLVLATYVNTPQAYRDPGGQCQYIALVVSRGCGVFDGNDEWAGLIRSGEQMFPFYELILGSPFSNPNEIGGTLTLLTNVKKDRSRFTKYALHYLAYQRSWVRIRALHLLDQIGSERDASPIVALLSDETPDVVLAAATTLGTIGGPREVIAMDI